MSCGVGRRRIPASVMSFRSDAVNLRPEIIAATYVADSGSPAVGGVVERAAIRRVESPSLLLRSERSWEKVGLFSGCLIILR